MTPRFAACQNRDESLEAFRRRLARLDVRSGDVAANRGERAARSRIVPVPRREIRRDRVSNVLRAFADDRIK